MKIYQVAITHEICCYTAQYFLFLDAPLGDVLNWNEAEWELSNVKRIDLDTSDFCIDFPEKNYFMIPERRSLESGYDVCHILGTVNQNSEFLSDIV